MRRQPELPAESEYPPRKLLARRMYVAGYPYREIAEHLEVSESTAQRWVTFPWDGERGSRNVVRPSIFIMRRVEFRDCGFGSDCWVWTGTRIEARGGYGTVNRSGATEYAHRYSYEVFRGEIPKGLVLDHLCQNPPCVNPDHLEPVTQAVNCRRGGQTKLTLGDVAAIRSSTEAHKDLAERFGVHSSHISRIRSGKVWAAE